MTILVAAAVLTLWRSGRLDTLDIASALHVAEPDVCRIIHAANERERGPDLHVVRELA
ncbi:MAG: hypothetical protein ACTHJQ_22750 [Rhizobiaceae bacterium]